MTADTTATERSDATAPAPAGLQHVAAFLLYAALAIALLWPAVAGNQVVSAAGNFLSQGPFPLDVRLQAGDPIALLGDPSQQFSPWLRYAADGFARDGRIPLWKNTASCGAPLLGNGQSALFFPTHLLAIVLGAPAWIHTLETLVKLVGGAFCAWLLARHLRLSFLAALACGLVFGFGGYEVVFLQHPHTNVSMLLPLLLLAADAVALRPTAGRVAGLALVAGLQHLGGHAETAFHCQFAALALGAARCLSLRHERATGSVWRRLAALVAGLALGAGLGALQTFPLLEYIGESDKLRLRSQGTPHMAENARWQSIAFLLGTIAALWCLRRLATAKRRLLWPALGLGVLLFGGLIAGVQSGLFTVWMQLLASDWYGDIHRYLGLGNWVEQNGAFAGAALPLVMLGLIAGRPRGPVRAAGVLLVFGLLVGFNAPVVGEIVQALPVFRLVANIRMLLLALLASAVLAGFGIDALGQLARGSSHRLRLALAVLVPVAAAYAVIASGTLSGWLPSPNVPDRPASAEPVHATLLPEIWDRRLWPLLPPLAPQEGVLVPPEDAKIFVGLVASRRPVAGVRLVYGRDWQSVPCRWASASVLDFPDHPSPSVPGVPDLTAYAFEALAPFGDFPPERSAVRLWVVFSDGAIGMSDLLTSPEDSLAAALPFPAQPATGGARLQLLWLALVALLAVSLLHARGGVLIALRVTLLLLVGASLYGFVQEAIPLLPPQAVYPASPPIRELQKLAPDGRVLNLHPNTFPPETPTAYGIRDVGGYDALQPWRIARLLRAATDIPGADSPVENLPLRRDPDLGLLGLMSVEAISDFRDVSLTADVKRFRIDTQPWADPFFIATNPLFLPRARLVTGADVEADDERALALLRGEDYPRESSVVLAAGEPRAPAAGEPGDARIVKDRPDSVRVEIHPARDGYLVLADTFFPGWRALVDGQPREILRANVAFRAVAVGPDDRVVEFRYEPFSYRAGVVVSLLCGLLVVALCAAPALLLRRRRGPPPDAGPAGARQAAPDRPQSAA